MQFIHICNSTLSENANFLVQYSGPLLLSHVTFPTTTQWCALCTVLPCPPYCSPRSSPQVLGLSSGDQSPSKHPAVSKDTGDCTRSRLIVIREHYSNTKNQKSTFEQDSGWQSYALPYSISFCTFWSQRNTGSVTKQPLTYFCTNSVSCSSKGSTVFPNQ